MTKPIAIDFETFSRCELRSRGLHNYAVDPSTGAHCLAFGRDPLDVGLWIEGQPFPQELQEHLDAGGIFSAWNAQFEFYIWNFVCVRRYGWPKLPLSQLECSMAQSYAMSLPGALEKAAIVLGVNQQKDAFGARVMMQLAKPRADGSLWRPADDPEKFRRLYEYCRQDVRTELAIRPRMLTLSPQEQALWRLDQKINYRGVQVDLPSIEKAVALVEGEQARLNKEMLRITSGVVGKCSEVQLLAKWVKLQGVPMESVNKSSVLDALDGDLPANVRAALTLRKEAAKTSTAKLVSMRERASPDGRVRGGFQYHGSSTGRWAHRGVQTGNFPRPRPGVKMKDIEDVLSHLDSRDHIDMFHGPVLDAVADSLRAMVTAAPGHELIAVDFSAIEARGIAWLAGQESALEIFRGDGKIYEHAAAGIYGKPMQKVTKDERQIGKVAILALGYGGGVGAFQNMATAYGITVTDELAEKVKVGWRKSNPRIVQYWRDLENAAINAIDFKDEKENVQSAGPKGREVRFKMDGSFLFCRLPSGRVLTYPFARMDSSHTFINQKTKKRITLSGDALKEQGEPDGCVRVRTNDSVLWAWAVNTMTNKWEEYSPWGGFLSENLTQAICRDLLAEAITRLEANGFQVVGHVHDEVIVEIPTTAPADTLQRIEEIMCVVPTWAKDFPISAEGWRGARYRK